MSENKSEVARLLQQIQEEYEAAQRGLLGLAEGKARHEFISKRFENMSNTHERLKELVGPDGAIALVATIIWTSEGGSIS
ncbi:MAG: hypothetical protein H0U76_10920 [Ktedonobacteraceae bacterium]|nr:hypothetical protein [Ktedonobacteraceae bacterium]